MQPGSLPTRRYTLMRCYFNNSYIGKSVHLIWVKLCMCMCNIYFCIQYTYISIQYIYLWCNKNVTDPHATYLVQSILTLVFLLHKHFLFVPSPYFNSASIITNCKYAAVRKPNVTTYEGYPENKFHLLILPLALRSWRCACMPSLLILWQGTDTVCKYSVSTHCLVFIMFKKIDNPTACEMWCVMHFLNVKIMKPVEIR